MTYKHLSDIIEKNNIPEEVRLMSDSGWECNETEMNGVWYSRKDNRIIFTQGDYAEFDSWADIEGYVCLHKK